MSRQLFDELTRPKLSDDEWDNMVDAALDTIPKCPGIGPVPCGKRPQEVHFVTRSVWRFDPQVDGSNGELLLYAYPYTDLLTEPDTTEEGVLVECEFGHQWRTKMLKLYEPLSDSTTTHWQVTKTEEGASHGI